MRPSLSRAMVQAPPLAPETSAYRARVALTAESLDMPRARRADRWATRRLKGAGIYSTMRRFNLCLGVTLAQSVVPLVNSGGAAVDSATALVAADYSEAAGWQTDGSTKYLRTGFIPDSSLGGQAAYLRTTQASAATVRILLGVRNTDSSQVFRIAGNSNGEGITTAGAVNASWGSLFTVGTPQPATTGGLISGLWHITRTSTSDAKLYRNGSQVGTMTSTITFASPSFEVYVMANNAAGTANAFLEANSRVAGYMIDSGMTAVQADAVSAIWRDYQTVMGRNV